MKELSNLLENNRKWAESKLQKDQNVFKKHVGGQSPKYLWIGCSDSRIPAHEMLGLSEGDVFVHRNIANVVPHSDMNVLSVIEYGVVHLGVEHVIVCGHYGCGGVAAAMENAQFGLIDNWLRHIRDVYSQEKEMINQIPDHEMRHKKLIELNVRSQVQNVAVTTIIQNAWKNGKSIAIHGWVYDIATGRIKDLSCSMSSLDEVEKVYQTL
ncbi:MAG: carbonic anhydrase [Simkaniaceae bacterium]|nr:carbonic anhydrase [Simkaniaceae bacterium]